MPDNQPTQGEGESKLVNGREISVADVYEQLSLCDPSLMEWVGPSPSSGIVCSATGARKHDEGNDEARREDIAGDQQLSRLSLPKAEEGNDRHKGEVK